MISNMEYQQQVASEANPGAVRLRFWLMGLGIAALFWVVVLLVAPTGPANAAQVYDANHYTISDSHSLGMFTLTIYADNSLELSWQESVDRPEDIRATENGVWLNSRGGSIGINR